MPKRPNVPCSYPRCPNLVPVGKRYCEQHKSHEEVRSATARGYGYRWQKARKRFLEAHPLCEECLKRGRYTEATDVDHIIPHRGNKTLFWDESNWQSLCHRCHSQKTAKEDMNPEYHF